MFLVKSEEIRNIDKICVEKFGISEKILMENAGRSAANYFFELFGNTKKKKVGIFAGKGNNGGDSFVMARYLVEQGFFVTIFLLSKKEQIKSNISRHNLNIIFKFEVNIFEMEDEKSFDVLMLKSIFEYYDVFVDSIFGVGLTSNIEGHYKSLIDFLNKTKKPIFSVDIPSGIDSDSGQICGTCIKAYATISFAYPKLGLFLFPGCDYVGQLKIVNIGIPSIIPSLVGCRSNLLEYDNIKNGLVARKSNSHKGLSGHLLMVAGSYGKTGAAIMSSMAAMRAGVGLATLCVPESLNSIFESSVIEVMTYGLPDDYPGVISKTAYDFLAPMLDNKGCIVFGPGIGITSGTFVVLEQLVENSCIPMLIDADGITLISKSLEVLRNKRCPVILTPHLGEMSRLTNLTIDEISKNKIDVARNFSVNFDVYVVLKGENTVIANPDGEVFVNVTGNTGMASAGMGDVLTGIISSFITQGYAIDFSLKLAVYIHGLGADFLSVNKGVCGYLATDLIEYIPEQIDKIFRNKEIKPNYLCNEFI